MATINPVQTMIMMHYHVFCDDWEGNNEALYPLVEHKMLLKTNNGDSEKPKYRISPRGTAYVESIRRVTLPELRWVPFDQEVTE